MSVVKEFNQMMTRAWNAIDEALLNGVGESARDVMQQFVYDNVYSYQASWWAMQKRRYADGGLGDKDNMIVSLSETNGAHELQVENFAGLQDYGPNFRGGFNGIGPSPAPGHYAARLDRIVEEGDPAYRQPGPRPFYADTEKFLVNNGIVDNEITSALVRAGFEVI